MNIISFIKGLFRLFNEKQPTTVQPAIFITQYINTQNQNNAGNQDTQKQMSTAIDKKNSHSPQT
ncbi:MAG: hypothetical protein AABY34_05270 [Pseudomonadota bacterium]